MLSSALIFTIMNLSISWTGQRFAKSKKAQVGRVPVSSCFDWYHQPNTSIRLGDTQNLWKAFLGPVQGDVWSKPSSWRAPWAFFFACLIKNVHCWNRSRAVFAMGGLSLQIFLTIKCFLTLLLNLFSFFTFNLLQLSHFSLRFSLSLFRFLFIY